MEYQPPERPITAVNPKRGFWKTVKDSLLEKYPEAKPWTEYLGERIFGMRLKRWVWLLIAALCLVGSSAYISNRITIHLVQGTPSPSQIQLHPSSPTPPGLTAADDKSEVAEANLQVNIAGHFQANGPQHDPVKAYKAYGKAYIIYYKLASNSPNFFDQLVLVASDLAANCKNANNPKLSDLAYRVAGETPADHKSQRPTKEDAELFEKLKQELK